MWWDWLCTARCVALFALALACLPMTGSFFGARGGLLRLHRGRLCMTISFRARSRGAFVRPERVSDRIWKNAFGIPHPDDTI